jgi:hypothetical protein
MPFPNYIGHQRLWTRENVIKGLIKAAAELKGQLPSSDHVYNVFKKNRLDLPPSHRILEYFETISRAWIAAGIKPKRVSLTYSEWNDSEILYLKENIGNKLIQEIAKDLRRSYGAVRRQLYNLKITSRGNQGYFSAALVAEEYHCSYDRVLKLLRTGVLPGAYSLKRHRWLIDVRQITPEIIDLLKVPRITHNTWPMDVGDWAQRNNIHRHLINGKMVRVEEPVKKELLL